MEREHEEHTQGSYTPGNTCRNVDEADIVATESCNHGGEVKWSGVMQVRRREILTAFGLATRSFDLKYLIDNERYYHNDLQYLLYAFYNPSTLKH